jgi:LPS-assembly protein
VAAAVCSAGLAAELPSEDRPVLISADQITYDEALGLVVARGHVEISQGDRILLADTVTYNERTDTVAASGNVALLEPSGDVAFAEYVELTSDLKEGVIRDIRVLLRDNSRIAANGGRRSGGDRTEFAQAVYSPCELCREDPTRPPLWQLKAERVVHDQSTHRIEYRDAWLEIYGVPLAYTPYFSHPDPTVDRQSGFLTPQFSYSQSLGLTATVPYYFNIAPDLDATFEPILTTKQGAVLAGELRKRFASGEAQGYGSITRADRKEDDGTDNNVIRGHIDAFSRFDIDETWRAGADLERTTDKTYLRLYDYSDARTLTSRLYGEGFTGRSYGLGRGLLFQGLREGDHDNELPIALPELSYAFVGEPGRYGNYLTFDANALSLTRIDGRDVNRLSGIGGAQLPHTFDSGHVTRLSATLETTGYWVDQSASGTENGNPQAQGDDDDGATGRIFPQAAAEWRYPLAQHSERFTQVLQPLAAVVVGPNDPNPNKIPNEDSQDFEFDETNLLDPDRRPGIDRADGGQRVDYGLRWDAFLAGGGVVGGLVGQSYRFGNLNDFSVDTGISDQLSDIVGRVQIRPYDELDLLYRFRFDHKTLASHRSEVQLRAGPPRLNLNLSYLFLDQEEEEEFGDREELTARVAARVDENWSGSVFGRRDLEANRTLSYGLGLAFQNECIIVQTEVSRQSYRDREIEPETQVVLKVTFKTLGNVGTN